MLPDKLKDEIDRLETSIKALCESKEVPFESRKQKKEKVKLTGDRAESVFHLSASSSTRPLSEEERLRQLIDELSAEVADEDHDIEQIKAKMELVGEMFDELMVEEMRKLLKQTTGADVETREKVTRTSVIASMEAALSVEFSMAPYLRKPVQPKGISRAAWLEHLKMAKKFAEFFSITCALQRVGDLEKLDEEMATLAVYTVDDWSEKFKKNPLDRDENISQLVAYEIIKRLEEHEYFYCTFCNTVEFNVQQHLAHYASGVHCKHARGKIDAEGKVQAYALTAKHLLNLSKISEEVHNYYSTQYSAPYLESGAKVPNPDKHTIPTLEFLADIDRQYWTEINGELEVKRLKDSPYVSSVLPEIFRRHKSKIGKKLFEELDQYFAKGKMLFCHRCRVTVSNRTLFYRHIRNPFHIGSDYLEDGRQFNLLTFSINIHTRESSS
ncbi:hypothetical protein PMAYCL1PPCAC_32203 [Pristionchus mayeri]|uniref:C2H2-type domain-containing protein n=1 Tax=Pristionchus mayeri TaxID=1317129 RepID=A0AAN5ID87_9BILA|nr:hypothetical protein PMAYCL1PPCAC_32203 [Pristionchus mayeri]